MQQQHTLMTCREPPLITTYSILLTVNHALQLCLCLLANFLQLTSLPGQLTCDVCVSRCTGSGSKPGQQK